MSGSAHSDGKLLRVPGLDEAPELLTPTAFDEVMKERTGREKPHNYGLDWPEECVTCGASLDEDSAWRLAKGWLLCRGCELPMLVADFPYLSPAEYHLLATDDAADGYVFLERMDYNPLGGFWIPTTSEHAERDHPATGDLVRYPADPDRSPKIVGESELPDWVRA